jgi:aspartate kinase
MSHSISADGPIAVIKMGGSIFKTEQSYRQAATYVRNRHFSSPHERLVVVVSAQEGLTDELAATAAGIVSRPNPAALDLLWSTGELRSVALLALHLQALGLQAAPLGMCETGLTLNDTRAGLNRTSEVHFDSRRLHFGLAQHAVAVVPGFFATNATGGAVSLGRGGSDLTAVLLAQGLKASRCELIKDVPGYFNDDPHLNPAARHLTHLTFEEALAFADAGCNLVQRKAVELASQANIPLVIRGLDESAPFTGVSSQAHGQLDNAETEKFSVETLVTERA